MPELKRNFLKGKMNKDLDERLVPNGEYRDALNIQISTSEGANQGSVQTLNGNVELTPQILNSKTTLSAEATTVGSIVDDSNGYIYNFVHKAANLESDGTGIISDAIIQLKPKNTYSSNESTRVEFTPIITDVFEARYKPNAFSGNLITGLPSSVSGAFYGIVLNTTEGIVPGMRVQAIDANGVDLWAGADIRVINQDSSGNVSITSTSALSSVYTAQNKLDGVYIKFSKPRFLNFSSGTSELELNVGDGSNSSATPKNTLITGINIFDEYLVFTDGRTEPKKINITRSKKGTTSVRKNTLLYVENNGSLVNTFETLDESHITNIRINPRIAPKVDIFFNDSPALGSDPLAVNAVGSLDAQGSYDVFELALPGNETFATGQVFYIQTLSSINIEVGDVIQLTGNTSSHFATASINAVYSNNKYRIIIRSVDPAYDPSSVNAEYWRISKVKSNTFYNEDFVYFAYRYVYTDGEKSCISPYSSAAFFPGTYAYSSEDGFNLGMQNLGEKFEIKNFALDELPKDVVEIELIIRSSGSDNAYVFRSIKIGSTESLNGGLLTIEAEQAGTTIPSNQLVRNFDALPKKAIAQEFSAGRIIYGNYTQDYDLKDDSGQNITPTVLINSESISNDFSVTSEGNGNFQATRTLSFINVSEQLLLSGGYSLDSIFPNPWYQRLRKIASTSSSPYTDDTSFIYATERGLYCGFEGLQNPNGVYNIDGTGTTADPYEYYYTAPATGTYQWNIQLKAVYRNVAFNNYRVALYECNQSGEILNLDATYNTSPTPLWYSGITNGIANVEGESDSLTELFLAAEVDLIQNKYYQMFIVANVEPEGINANGTVANFETNGLSDTNVYGSDNSIATPISILSASVSVSASPATTFTLPSLQGTKSVKSIRTYKVGVVYRDQYGRESSVLIDEAKDFEITKDFSKNKNIITTKILNNAPKWAETYKFFIKETSEKYHNLVLNTAFDNNDDVYAWLVFNSADINKVKVGDYLIQKKGHGNNTAITSSDAKWKVIDIQGAIGEDSFQAGSSTSPTVFSIGDSEVSISNAIISSASDLIGKFFVKVNYDSNFTTHIGTIANVQAAISNNGAVFETETKQKIDLDLYYEVGDAYPIRLTKKLAKTYIKPGSKIEVSGVWSSTDLSEDYDLLLIENELNVENNSSALNDSVILYVEGTDAFPTNPDFLNNYDDYLCKIFVNNFQSFYTEPLLGSVYQNGLILKIKNEDGSFVEVQQIGPISEGLIRVKPYTHPTSIFPDIKLNIGLPWFNCVSFGNGVESDSIRDDFNSKSIYDYVASGKTSGFKSSVSIEKYEEVEEKNKLIYSSIYNEEKAVNKINEFIFADNIVKSVNPENGSIQKLFTRDTDLVVFCESKVFRGPINKDIIFNADGAEQLVASNKVIGTLKPYSSGDYGISTNPESFAADEFRMYFVDKNRGAVLRLSADGITPIHEYGMEDWFNDNLKSAQAVVGSFDDNKGEYNVTIHDLVNPGWKKNVYTLSFDESVNGWVSFKSFIPEQGVSLNNQYFTFKNGDLYLHHYPEVNRNKFYGTDYDSSITPILNDVPESVKQFKTLNYEGTQSKVNQFATVSFEGSDYTDGEYYNLESKTGWSVDYINTDLQQGKVSEFINKEGKWFNNITGVENVYVNSNEGSNALNNLDASEQTTHGIGSLSSDATIASGSISESYSLTFNNTYSSSYAGEWTTEGINLYDITSLSGSTTNTFIINPLPGFVIDAINFSNSATSSYYSSVAFTNTGTANTPSNTVQVTVTWVNQAISASGNIPFEISADIPVDYNSTLQGVINVSDPYESNYNLSFVGGEVTASSASAGDYTFTGNVPINEEFNLTSFILSASSGYVFMPEILPSINVFEGFNPIAIDIPEVVYIYDDQGYVTGIQYNINAISSGDIYYADGVTISLNVGNTQAITASWLAPELSIDDATEEFEVGFYTNGGAPTFTIESGATWINSVTLVEPVDGGPYTSAIVDVDANTGAAREADITIYDSTDTTQSSGNVINIQQDALDSIQLISRNSLGVVQSTTTKTVGPSNSIFMLTVVTNGGVPVSGDFTFNYTVGTGGWLTFNYVEESQYQIDPYQLSVVYDVYFTPTENNSSALRTVIITSTHTDNVATDTITVNQENTYDSSSDTIQFTDVSGSSISSISVDNESGTATGYLIASGGQNPNIEVSISPAQAAVMGATSIWNISDITAVSGQPYTHTFNINYFQNIQVELLAATLSYQVKAFYVGDFPAQSNNTSVPDDILTVNQNPADFASFTSPGTTNSPFSMGSVDSYSFGELGDWSGTAFAFYNNGVNIVDSTIDATGGIEFGIYATNGFTLGYIEFTTPAEAQSLDWSNDTVFSGASSPSWITSVSITNPSTSGGYDGSLSFGIADTSPPNDFRGVAIGIFPNGETSNPSDVLVIYQNLP